MQSTYDEDDGDNCLDKDGWQPCAACGKKRAKLGFRTTVDEMKAFVLVSGPGTSTDQFIDCREMQLVDETLFCFACYTAKFGNQWIDDIPEAKRRDEPLS